MTGSFYFETIVYTFAAFGFAILLGEIFTLIFYRQPPVRGDVVMTFTPGEGCDVTCFMQSARAVRDKYFEDMEVIICAPLNEAEREQARGSGFHILEAEDGGRTPDD